MTAVPVAALPVSYELLTELFIFDPDTGEITHKGSKKNQVRDGQVAGYIENSGYRRITINGRLYAAHKLMWCYVTKKFPDHELDHINLDKSDNRFINLRAVTKSQNCMNRRVRSDSLTGHRGVRFHKSTGLFHARISKNGDRWSLGYFKKLQDALDAYANASLILHGGFGRTI